MSSLLDNLNLDKILDIDFDKLTSMNYDKNVGKTERIISAVAGSLILLHGLKKGKSIPELSLGGFLLFRGATGYCPVSEALTGTRIGTHVPNINIKASIIINKPRNEVYTFWRKLENLPLFMKHLESVTVIDDKKSLWKANIPGGLGTIDWEGEIVDDQVNERIGWQSLPDSEVWNAGNVHFKDAGTNMTEVYAVISYEAPGGVIGEGVGKLLNPVFEKMVQSDIENLKEYLETKPSPTQESRSY